MSLQELQQAFLRDLIGSNREQLAGFLAEEGPIPRTTQLNIYRKAYLKNLLETLATEHAMLRRYVKDKVFLRLIREYLQDHESRESSLRHFGDALPDFLETHPNFSRAPQLAELARFERLRLQTADAAAGTRVTMEEMTDLSAEQWSMLTLHLHPSVQVARFDYPAVTIWRAVEKGQKPPPANRAASAWLIYRDAKRIIRFRAVEPDEQAALERVSAGAPFSDVNQTLLRWHDTGDAQARSIELMSGWVEEGLVAELAVQSDGMW
ncbi:MAG: DNA-binding domain-containing protein [Pseudomonadota bacterium]